MMRNTNPLRLCATTPVSSKITCIVFAVAAAIPLATLAPTFASAQETAAPALDGGKARVNKSNNLRTLTEAVASYSCMVDAGIAADTARTRLTSSRRDFGRIMDGLMHGDAALGMPEPETRPLTIRELEATNALWEPVAEAVEKLIAGAGSDAEMDVINESTVDLYSQTEHLATFLAGQYANPQELLQSDATVLNFAIRQRTLTYRMSRAMCELAKGAGSEETQKELAANLDIFQQTLFALRDGMPAVGINPPPNAEVRESLEATVAIWLENRAVFDAVASGQMPTADDVGAAADIAASLATEMNTAINLYLAATR